MSGLRRAGYEGIAAREWEPNAETAPPRARKVIVTFDDAYADLTRFALPVLADVGFRATVFVVAGAIGGSNSWDAPGGAGGHRLMDEADLRDWATSGCEIGSHGMTHVDLTSLPPEQLDLEIAGSQRALTSLACSPVSSFAYPYGKHDPRVRRAVTGTYCRAFGIDEGRNLRFTDTSQLRRTMVQPADSIVDVLLRARFGWSAVERARTVARPRTRARAVRADLRARAVRRWPRDIGRDR
jgi:peptidoglycan/xylan/chitin deacetylase (PgdA/CDA1 family)